MKCSKMTSAFLAVAFLVASASAQAITWGGASSHANLNAAFSTYIQSTVQARHPGATVSYVSSSSGTGQSSAFSGAYDIGVSGDAVASLPAGFVQVPYSVGQIALVATPGFRALAATLKLNAFNTLNATQLVSLYYGGVRNLTSTVRVTAVARNGSSGSTYTFTSYLNKVGSGPAPSATAPSFAASVVRASSSSSVVSYLKNATNGWSIGYVDVQVAIANGLDILVVQGLLAGKPTGFDAAILNTVTKNFTLRALDLVKTEASFTNYPFPWGDWTPLDLAQKTEIYPMAYFTYLIFKSDLTATGTKAGLIKDIVKFLVSSNSSSIINNIGFTNIYPRLRHIANQAAWSAKTSTYAASGLPADAQPTLVIGGSSAQAPYISTIINSAQAILNSTTNSEYFGYAISYNITNSGTGLANAASGAYDIGVSDDPYDVVPTNVANIPVIIGTIVIAAHPALTLTTISAAQLVSLYKDGSSSVGSVAVTAVGRSDNSGSTDALTTFLNKYVPGSFVPSSVPAWNSKVVTRSGTGAVASYIKATTGSVGYLSYQAAVANGLKILQVIGTPNTGAVYDESLFNPQFLSLFKTYPLVTKTWNTTKPALVDNVYPLGYYGFAAVKVDVSALGYKSSLVKAFVGYLLSPSALSTIAAADYNPTDAGAYATAYAGWQSIKTATGTPSLNGAAGGLSTANSPPPPPPPSPRPPPPLPAVGRRLLL